MKVVDLDIKRVEKYDSHIRCGDEWIHYSDYKGSKNLILLDGENEIKVRLSGEIFAIEYDKTIPVYTAISEDGVLITCIHLNISSVLRELTESFEVIEN